MGPGTFERCTSLEKITLPSSISKLSGTGIFKDCKALTELELPSLSSNLDGKDMFAGSGLETLTFKNGSFTVWGDVFANLEKDLTIRFESGVPAFKDTAFGDSAVDISIILQDQYFAKKEALQTQFAAKENIHVMTVSSQTAVKTVEVSGLEGETNRFPTLKEAVNAVNEDGGNGPYTITLLKDTDLKAYSDFSLPKRNVLLLHRTEPF